MSRLVIVQAEAEEITVVNSNMPSVGLFSRISDGTASCPYLRIAVWK